MNITRIERSSDVEFGLYDLPWQGIVACALLIAQIILLLAALYISYLSEGNAGLPVGVAGLLVLLMSAEGVVIAALGLKKKTIKHGLCMIGGIGSLIVLGTVIALCINAG